MIAAAEKSLVEPGAVIEAASAPSMMPRREAEHGGGQREHERIAERAEQLVRHRPVGEEGDAEVADQERPSQARYCT